MNHSVAPREEGEGEFERMGNMWNPVHESMDMMITCIRTLQREREKDQTLYMGLREQYRQKNELVQVLNNENLELRQEVLKLNEERKENLELRQEVLKSNEEKKELRARIHRCQEVVTKFGNWDPSKHDSRVAEIVWKRTLNMISQHLNGSEFAFITY